MNPLWALLFKDRFRNPFSMFKMSLAELIVLLCLVGGCIFGIWRGAIWILETEGTKRVEEVEEHASLPASLWPPRLANPPYYYGVDK